MKLQDIVENIVRDTAVELTQEFDRNFERKAFFNDKWPESNHANSRGSLMMRSGALRRSIQQPKVGSSLIQWKSSLPYAGIHNEGGKITVTAKMKSFFWAMYYKAAGGITKTKAGKASKNQRNSRLGAEAAKWKALALQKVGATMTIEQRQFIGWHPVVDGIISDLVADNMKEFNKALHEKLKGK